MKTLRLNRKTKLIFWAMQLLICLGMCCTRVYGQGNEVSKIIIDKLSAFSANHTVEKAYLQFDKPYYAVGDTIYFKAYVTIGEHHQLSPLSTVLHVDLINTKNKIDQSIKLHLDSGVAWGDFALPDSLPKGNYRIRAYTQWMRNDGESAFFDRIIPIASIKTARIPESIVKAKPLPELKPDVQFFPEGGNLVTGILSKIAFKGIGANGMGVDVKGQIIDNDNQVVVSFSSAHLGMGYFYITPKEGKSYSARIIGGAGQPDLIALPKADPAGVVLSVNNDSLPKATVSIRANQAYYLQNRGKEYTLVIYSQGSATTVTCKLDSPVIKLDVLKRRLHTGVATVTLFSPDNEPLCERLLFVQNYDQLAVRLNSDKESYAPRSVVNINLKAMNRKGDFAEGHFSVSVIDETKVPENESNGDNILSYLLLTSDLKGYIEQPGYYFANNSQAAIDNLDDLMLTQGFRRFEWKALLNGENETLAYLPEKGLTIEGEVRSLFNKPVARGTINLIPANKGPLLTATTDNKGAFKFSNLIFTDTTHFVLSAVNGKGNNTTKISYVNKADDPLITPLKQQFVSAVSDTAIWTYANNDKLQQAEFLSSGNAKVHMLKQVKILEKLLDNQYHTESLAGAGHADQVMHADEIERVQGPLTMSLEGRLHGVMFVGNPPNRYPVLTLSTMVGTVKPMFVIVDGVEGSSLDFLSANDVETVEVLRTANTSIYGMNGAGGVLIVTTKSGGKTSRDIASIGVLPIAPMGFYKAREFYAPKYDNNTWVDKQKDLRSTIYWNPEIKTGKDGNASFTFYNADGTGSYKLIVEGIDNNGNIGRQEYKYMVQ